MADSKKMDGMNILEIGVGVFAGVLLAGILLSMTHNWLAAHGEDIHGVGAAQKK